MLSLSQTKSAALTAFHRACNSVLMFKRYGDVLENHLENGNAEWFLIVDEARRGRLETPRMQTFLKGMTPGLLEMPLYSLAKDGKTQAVRILLSYGADGAKLQREACESGEGGIVETLMRTGIDPFASGAYTIAKQRGHAEILHMFDDWLRTHAPGILPS